MLVFFFLKQKTAYEMRISDWSSDVCSSDLDPNFDVDGRLADGIGRDLAVRLDGDENAGLGRAIELLQVHAERAVEVEDVGADRLAGGVGEADAREAERSEEHTSELQSLMRISYAVFCLKKKKKHNT